MDIAKASESDYPAIREMLQAYHDEFGGGVCFSGIRKELDELPGDYAPPNGGIFLLKSGNEITGMVAMRRADLPEHTAEIKRLYVKPAFRGQGFGQALTKHCVEEATASGYEAVVLDTLLDNVASHKLYESFGFERCGPWHGRLTDCVVFYRLDLGVR